MKWTEQEYLSQSVEFIEGLSEYKNQISKKAESEFKRNAK